MRPNETAPLRLTGGEVVKSKDWDLRKAVVFAGSKDVQTE